MINPETKPVQQIALAVAGMHCASCVTRVTHELKQIPGVREVEVNLVTGRADITAEAGADMVKAAIAAVAKAGYRATLWSDAALLSNSLDLPLLKVAVCALLSLPLAVQMLDHDWGLMGMLSPWAMLALATPVQFWGGAQFYRGAWQALKAKAITMDVLAVLGTTIAYAVSAWRVASGQGDLVFEAAALTITFLLAGRWIEARMRRRALAAVHHLITLQPQEARLVAEDGQERMTPLSAVQTDDIVAVWAGERVPLDGQLVAGQASFDLALITGEAKPRALEPGDPVIAGALCLSGSVTVKVTNPYGKTMLDRMADMVVAAQSSRAPFQRMTDAAAHYFTIGVITAAILALLLWIGLKGDAGAGLNAALAVLLMACPCALGLAVPIVVAVAVGQAARHGILVRNAAALEQASLVTTVIFDKTGTLSQGAPELAETMSFGDFSSDQLLVFAAALNQRVNHPLAASLRALAAARPALVLPALREEPEIVYGRGVRGRLQDGRELVCGNLLFMAQYKVPLEDAAATAAGWEERGRSMIWLAVLQPKPQLLGIMAFRDALRPEAQEAIERLTQGRYQLAVLSGDNRDNTLSVAKRLGIGQSIGEAMPQDKLQEIHKRQRWGEIVAMVGDGINDAPALAAADLGIAVGSGVAAADAAAPVRILRDDLRLIPALFGLARMARGAMIVNIGWAIGFNAIALPLAVLGRVPPQLAALSMVFSSLAVIGMALTLKWWRPHV